MHHNITEVVGGLHRKSGWNDHRQTRSCIAER